jgi:hypothetical protein
VSPSRRRQTPRRRPHAAVSDDREAIRLTLYRERKALASAEIEPRRALRLAGELLQTALRWM